MAEWIRCFHPTSNGAVRLVCFPHAGGAASFFFPASAALQPRAEVLAVQYPGRQDRQSEPALDDVPTLAEQAFDALRPWFADRLVFFGHSLGAAVAFEVARQMERETGVAPVHVVASGRRAPSRPYSERVHLLDDEGIVAELERMGGTDPALLRHEGLLRMILPTLRCDYQADELYEAPASAKLASPITVFVGDDDPTTTLDQARAWQDHTTGDFAMEVFGGGHFYLTDHTDEVMERLTGLLD
jgi:surfactin synthase thioesterase subunit